MPFTHSPIYILHYEILEKYLQSLSNKLRDRLGFCWEWFSNAIKSNIAVFVWHKKHTPVILIKQSPFLYFDPDMSENQTHIFMGLYHKTKEKDQRGQRLYFFI
jgi:hypothetical protein